MAQETSRWHAKAQGTLRVFRDGLELGRYPNRTAGVLLIGLLSRLGEWSSRSEVAILLYPGQPSAPARAALRQCILRMRTWLGDGAIEFDLDRIRLNNRDWTSDLVCCDQSTASFASITPDLSHSWLDVLKEDRNRESRQLEPNEMLDGFQTVVEQTAAVDRDAARSLLIGGSQLFDLLKPEIANRLLSVTIPKDRRDPLACEYLELLGIVQLRAGAVSTATSTYLRAHRLALQARDPGAISRIHALTHFAMLEAGNLALAREWYLSAPTGKGIGPSQLLRDTAQSAFYWNANRYDEAIACMDRSKVAIRGTDRAQRLHYWRNYSVLCAEAGRAKLSEGAELKARELLVPEIDAFSEVVLGLARGTRLIVQGRPAEAKLVFDNLVVELSDRGWVLTKLYAEEAEAEALARCGDLAGASHMWRAVRAKRTQLGARLTPRVAARQARLSELHVQV